MRLIFLGAPGAGKSTVAKLLTQLDGSVQTQPAIYVRGAVQAGSELDNKAKGYMDRGDLVPDDLILDIMKKRFLKLDCQKSFLLDGFPRTIPQADALKKMLAKLNIELDMAVNLEVPREVILDRLSTRRTCVNTKYQAIYNVKSMPPKVAGKCDKCGSEIVQRADETEAAISKRLDTYNEKTAPLIGFYKKEGLLFDVNTTSSDTVVNAIKLKVR